MELEESVCCDDFEKPACYDNAPLCLCDECQFYDIMMSFFADPSSYWLDPQFRESITVAESTSGLAAIDAACGVCKRLRLHQPDPVPDPVPAPVHRFLSRPDLDFADSSLSCFLPVCDPVPSDPVSPVCTSSVPSSSRPAPFGSCVVPSVVPSPAPSSASVCASPVAVCSSPPSSVCHSPAPPSSCVLPSVPRIAASSGSVPVPPSHVSS